MRFITDKPNTHLSNHKLKLAETDPPPTPFSDVANQSTPMTCTECGREYLRDILSTHCATCNQDLCGYDCATKHQEHTGHYLTHLTS
jgi:hypothetical protein